MFLVTQLQTQQLRNEAVSLLQRQLASKEVVNDGCQWAGMGQGTRVFHYIHFWGIRFCNHVHVSLINIIKFFVG
jgi:hypothetical protein